jgi:hypothetical protein
MTINGHTLTAEQEAAMIAAMTGTFTMYVVQRAAAETGVPDNCNMRSADRILQRERKAGRIKHVGVGKWQKL